MLDIYILDANLQRLGVIDKYSSLIWTERYMVAGDARLAVEPTEANLAILKENAFITIPGSREVVFIETVRYEGGLLIASGESMLKFLNNRYFRSSGIPADTEISVTTNVGQMLQSIAVFSAMAVIDTDSGGHPTGLESAKNNMSQLSLGTIDTTGAAVTEKLAFGPAYDLLISISQKYHVGVRMVLDSISGGTYYLKFEVYRGVDRTGFTNPNNVVRFAVSEDSLVNNQELMSVSDLKGTAYVYAPNHTLFTLPIVVNQANLYGGAAALRNFLRRIIAVVDTDITDADYPTLAEMQAECIRQGYNALNDHDFVRTVDGDISPTSRFVYGVDYNLGDKVQVGGLLSTQFARVTEYTRAIDASGERAYPTLTPVSPLE